MKNMAPRRSSAFDATRDQPQAQVDYTQFQQLQPADSLMPIAVMTALSPLGCAALQVLVEYGAAGRNCLENLSIDQIFLRPLFLL